MQPSIAPLNQAPLPSLSQARVAVLYGGTSEEHEVSLESGQGMLNALRATTGVSGCASRVEGIEITKSGGWKLALDEPPLALTEALGQLQEFDLCVLGLHGGYGENGQVQALLQALQIPFTGSGVASSAICMDKLLTRSVVSAAGLRIAAGVEVTQEAWRASGDLHLGALGPLRSDGGWVVKPRRGGSSLGMSILQGLDEDCEPLARALEAGFRVDASVLVEEFVSGIEVSVGVLDFQGSVANALAPVEITPRAGRFYDYEEKYSEESARLTCPPRSLSESRCERLQGLAVTAHKALGCEGYSRSDFIVPDEGDPVFLETNTLPGMTSHSLLPCEAQYAGMDYQALCLAIARDGLARGARS